MNIAKQFTNYFKEAYVELKKVAWPTRRQAADLTVAVVVISVAVSLLVGAYDAVLRFGVQKALNKPAAPTSQTGEATQEVPVNTNGATPPSN